MARASTQTVFGFGCDLDWRPTSFVNAFPSTRHCSVCGLIPPATAMMPCRHLLCHTCYARSVTRSNQCPLDMEDFQEDDVVWSTSIDKESVMSRRVRCWNLDNGCNAEGVALEIIEHFANACRFHVVSCPSCGGNVMHVEMADHMESCGPPCIPRKKQPACDDNLVNTAAEVRDAVRGLSERCASIETKLASLAETFLPSIRDGLTANLIAVFSQTVEGAIERATQACHVETRASLADHSNTLTSEIEDILVEGTRSTVDAVVRECNRIVDAVSDKAACRALAEVQTGGPTAAAPMSKERARLLSDVSLKMTKCREKLREKETLTGKDAAKVLNMLAFSSLAVTNDALDVCEPREWTISNWNDFRCELGERGSYRRVGPSAYFYGYRLFTELSYHFPSSELRLKAAVREGLYDELLEWPVNLTPRVRFVHPTDESKNITLSEQFNWERCTTGEDHQCGYQTSSHGLGILRLERSGFTMNNSLRVEYDFVRPNVHA
ncbi:hypothetical protein HPB50_001774 [Hyalomma asiaticum]|uniref:Uncharacterized protein n=1 Tax=Hyalomma asiaticum TaxID=266040 RepID=A0ACB7T5K1_HYAAI|nr:hypothetical protein HPB50_001774 [Hyalomma asiaticum]